MSIYFKPNGSNDVVFRTLRLDITAYRESDIERVEQCLTDYFLCLRIGAEPLEDFNDIKGYIDDNIETFYSKTCQSVRLAIRDKDTQLFVGNIGIYKRDAEYVELGYYLHPDSEGNGYMVEALKPVIAHLKDLGKHVRIEIDKHNKRSIRVAKKLMLRNVASTSTKVVFE